MSPNPLPFSQKQDLPVSIALVALAGVVGGLMWLNPPTTLSPLIWSELDTYFEKELVPFGISFFATAFNLIVVVSWFSRVIGLQKQGRRLELLAGGKLQRESITLKQLTVSLAVFCLSFASARLLVHPEIPHLTGFSISNQIWVYLLLGFQVQVAISGFFISLSLARRLDFSVLLSSWFNRLPKFPRPKNGIVLGSIEEVYETGS